MEQAVSDKLPQLIDPKQNFQLRELFFLRMEATTKAGQLDLEYRIQEALGQMGYQFELEQIKGFVADQKIELKVQNGQISLIQWGAFSSELSELLTPNNAQSYKLSTLYNLLESYDGSKEVLGEIEALVGSLELDTAPVMLVKLAISKSVEFLELQDSSIKIAQSVTGTKEQISELLDISVSIRDWAKVAQLIFGIEPGITPISLSEVFELYKDKIDDISPPVEIRPESLEPPLQLGRLWN